MARFASTFVARRLRPAYGEIVEYQSRLRLTNRAAGLIALDFLPTVR